ncbi:hypothetical protein ACVWYK_000904 [Bradyrhizobium sp. USDA 4470]
MNTLLMKLTTCSSFWISSVAKLTNITISPTELRPCPCSAMPSVKIASTVMVVEARVITVTSAHQDSTGICAASSWSATERSPCTSDSTRTKLCTSATFPSASDARAESSLYCSSTAICMPKVLRTTKVVNAVKTMHSTKRRIASRQFRYSDNGSSTTTDRIAAKCSRKKPSQSRHSASVPLSITFINRPEWVPEWNVSGSCRMCSK